MKLSSFTTQFKLLLLLLLVFATNQAFAQARAQSDVAVTSVTLSAVKSKVPSTPRELPSEISKPVKVIPVADQLKCSVTVFTNNDDDAYQTMLVVVVPVEVSITSMPANATLYKAGASSPFAGYLVFSLGQMGVGESITVDFSFTKSVYGNTVGAYAYSASPDPNPANNYKDASY